MNHKKVFVIVMIIIIAIIGGCGFTEKYQENNKALLTESSNETMEREQNEEIFPRIIEYSDNSITEISYGKFFCQLTYSHVTRSEERQNAYIVTIEDDEKREGVNSQNYIEIYRNDDYLQESIRDSLWSNDSDIYGIFQYSKGIASEKIDIYEIVKKSTNEDIFLVCYSDEAYLIKTDYVFCCSGILDCNNQDEYLVEKCVVTLVDDCGLDGEQLVIKGIFNENIQTYQLGPNISGKEYYIQAEICMLEEKYNNTIILQQDDELLQEINWKSNGIYEPVFGDFNSDNYVDIALNCMPGIRNEDYCLYLWDAKLEEFVEFQCDTNLPYFECYKDEIRAWYNNTASTKTLVTYKWNGISLEKISEIEIEAWDNSSIKSEVIWNFLDGTGEAVLSESFTSVCSEIELHYMYEGTIGDIVEGYYEDFAKYLNNQQLSDLKISAMDFEFTNGGKFTYVLIDGELNQSNNLFLILKEADNQIKICFEGKNSEHTEFSFYANGRIDELGNNYVNDYDTKHYYLDEMGDVFELCEATDEDKIENVYSECEKLYFKDMVEVTCAETDNFIEMYSDFSMKENAQRMALIYFDEDSIPELLLFKDGEYRLYSYDDSEVKQITFEDETITADAYGFRHDFECPEGLAFFCFEYVPYRGLLRVHESNEEERKDHYLRYRDGAFVKELTSKSKDYKWYTYDGEKEISNEEFTKQLSTLGYDELVPCAYLYEDVMTAYENIERVSDTSKVLEDFVGGKIDAICAVEEICDIPENGFLMRSFDDLYEEITAGEEDWGSLEYIDYDNDGEEELLLHGYAGSCAFFDVIGNSVYFLLKTSSTTDYGHVAEINKKRVIERSDLSHVGRKYYWIMEYDSCGCLVDWFCLHVDYEGEKYLSKDEFWYRDKEISMEEFEVMADSIQRIKGDIKIRN